MKATFVRRLVSVAVVVGALILSALTFRDLDWKVLGEHLRASSRLAPLVLVPQGVSMLVEAWAWGRSMTHAGYTVRLRDIWAIRVATEAIYQLIPGGPVLSDSLKPLLLHQRAGLTIPAAIGATVYRKYLRLAGQGPYVLGAVLVGAPAITGQSVHWLGSDILLPSLAAVGVLLMVLSLGMGFAFRRVSFAMQVFGVLERVSFVREGVRSARRRFEECDEAARGFFQLSAPQVALPMLASGLCWTLEAAETWLILQILGAPVPLELVLGLDVALSLGRQMAVFLPAGIGLQEAGYLGALLALGVPQPVETAAALSVLKRGKELVWGVIGFSQLAPWGELPVLSSSPNRAPDARESAGDPA